MYGRVLSDVDGLVLSPDGDTVSVEDPKDHKSQRLQQLQKRLDIELKVCV